MMLERYARSFRANQAMPVPWVLEIGGSLGASFLYLRDESEEEGVECGCNLFMIRDSIEVGRSRKGEQSNINLDKRDQSANPNYIGAFHAHPYKRKMGGKARIGPSTDDIRNLLEVRGGSPIEFHFVFANTDLWLIVSYPWSRVQGTGQPPSNDVMKSYDYLLDGGIREDIWANGIRAINDAQDLDKKITIERNLWRRLPRFAAIFSQLNYVMNIEMAMHHRYSVYLGVYPKGKVSAGQSGIYLLRQA